MGYMDCFLSDVRILVEVGSCVMGGCTDQLDAAFVCLAIRVRSDECGEEGVVDVDDPHGVSRYEVVAEDLHVASHNGELDTVFGEGRKHLGFLLRLCVLRDGKVHELSLIHF